MPLKEHLGSRMDELVIEGEANRQRAKSSFFCVLYVGATRWCSPD